MGKRIKLTAKSTYDTEEHHGGMNLTTLTLVTFELFSRAYSLSVVRVFLFLSWKVGRG